MKIYHPLLNVSLPTVAELRERCSGDEARQILDTACLLAAHRRSCFTKLEDAYKDYNPDGHSPFKKYGQGHAWLSPRYRKQHIPSISQLYTDNYFDFGDENLNEIDILRALLRHNSEFVEACLFDGSDNPKWQSSTKFREDAKFWNDVSIPEGSGEQSNTIRTGWARKWALTFMQYPDYDIHLSTWLSSVINFFPAQWAKPYEDGLLISSEAYTRLITSFLDAAKKKGDPNYAFRNIPIVPPLYYDVHNLLEQANELLSSRPQLFIIGDDICSRNNLVNAIASNFNYFTQFNALNQIQEWGGGFIDEGDIDIEKAGPQDQSIFALIGNNFPEPEWCFKNQVATALSFYRQLASESKGLPTKFVVALSTDDYRLLVNIYPDLNKLPTLNIPQTNFQDTVAQTVVRLPLFLEFFNCQPYFYQVISFMYNLREQHTDIDSELQSKMKTKTSNDFSPPISFRRVYPGHLKLDHYIHPFTQDKLLESYFSLEKPYLGISTDGEEAFSYLKDRYLDKKSTDQAAIKYTLGRLLKYGKPFLTEYFNNFDEVADLFKLYIVSESLSNLNIPEINVSELNALLDKSKTSTE